MRFFIVYDSTHKNFKPTRELDGTEWRENYDIPERLESIKETLKSEYSNAFVGPMEFPESYINLTHDVAYVEWLKERSGSLEDGEEYFPKVFGWYDHCFDNGTPLLKNIFRYAWNAAQCALTGAQLLIDGADAAYVLTRPPGHHASATLCGGYCYFNNAALATEYLVFSDNAYVAILDLDFHHGNGSQAIFYERSDVLFLSIHGDPRYFFPYTGYTYEVGFGEGKGFNHNVPLPSGADGRLYLKELEMLCNILMRFDPDYVVVSLGLDTHAEDPLGGFELTDRDYYGIGKVLSGLGLPTLIVQEGGYNPEANARAIKEFFKGFLK